MLCFLYRTYCSLKWCFYFWVFYFLLDLRCKLHQGRYIIFACSSLYSTLWKAPACLLNTWITIFSHWCSNSHKPRLKFWLSHLQVCSGHALSSQHILENLSLLVSVQLAQDSGPSSSSKGAPNMGWVIRRTQSPWQQWLVCGLAWNPN